MSEVMELRASLELKGVHRDAIQVGAILLHFHEVSRSKVQSWYAIGAVLKNRERERPLTFCCFWFQAVSLYNSLYCICLNLGVERRYDAYIIWLMKAGKPVGEFGRSNQILTSCRSESMEIKGSTSSLEVVARGLECISMHHTWRFFNASCRMPATRSRKRWWRIGILTFDNLKGKFAVQLLQTVRDSQSAFGFWREQRWWLCNFPEWNIVLTAACVLWGAPSQTKWRQEGKHSVVKSLLQVDPETEASTK